MTTTTAKPIVLLKHLEDCAEYYMSALEEPQWFEQQGDDYLRSEGWTEWMLHRSFCCADSDKALCDGIGHDIVDRSSAGPDSGNMDYECIRCGQYWSVPLY